MKTIKFILIQTLALGFLGVAITLSACAIGQKEWGIRSSSDKPNVIIIFTDDLGWTDLGCYGSSFYETPVLDRLANQSAVFTGAYSACCVCSPTRAALMTGKYPQRVGFTNWLNSYEESGPNSAASSLPASDITIGEAFQQAGYRTGYVGKWHLGPRYEAMPKQHGFDWQMASCRHGFPSSYFFPYKGPYSEGDVPDLEDGQDGDYLTDILTDKGIGFIKETAKAGRKPFFLVLGHYAVHSPIEAPEGLVRKYEAKYERVHGTGTVETAPEVFDHYYRTTQGDPTYAGMMENLDRNIGKVLSALDSLGLRENTIIVFTSDNGGMSIETVVGKPMLPTSNLPLRAGKKWNYEGGIRVPTFISWPGHITPMRSSEPVITMDIYPTLLELTGCKQIPEQHLDGRSLVPLIRGTQTTLERPFLAWWYPDDSVNGDRTSLAILKEGWKLIHYLKTGITELYHLDEDQGEKNDLAKAEPERTRELLATLNQWLEETRQR